MGEQYDLDVLFLKGYGLPVRGDDPVLDVMTAFGISTTESNITEEDGQVWLRVVIVGDGLKEVYEGRSDNLNDARRLAFAEYLVHEKGKTRR